MKRIVRHGFFFPFILAFFCLLFITIAAGSARAAAWTYMVYIAGDNNLSQAALADVEEMRSATSNGNVNCVVQVECSPNYTFSLPAYMQSGYSTYRLLIANGTVTPMASIGNLDMGNPATLRDFIQWAAAAYPASRYALTIWDHGDGWKDSRLPSTPVLSKGAVQDETAGSFMSLADLGNAVRQAGVHLTLMDFDACLMGMYEVAYEFAGLADYLVFSEQIEPGAGNPYTTILNTLYGNSAMDGRQLGQTIVNAFVNSYRNSRNSVTKSAVDLRRVGELHNQLNQLSALLRGGMATAVPLYANARAQVQHYFSKANVDLVHYLRLLSPVGGNISSTAAALANFIEQQVVVANAYYSSTYTEGGVIAAANVDNSHGLAIYLPTVELLADNEMAAYAAISSNSSGASTWSQFVNDFIVASGGNPNATTTAVNGGFACAAVWLDTWGNLGDADVDIYVVEPDGTIGSCWIGSSTANGYYSPDSSVSGSSYEMYAAKPRIMPGTYLYIVNYYDDGYFDDYANVYLFYMDPVRGVDSWSILYDEANDSPVKLMSLYNPAPYIWTQNDIVLLLQGYYSDWWIPTATQRVLESLSLREKQQVMNRLAALAADRRGKRGTGNLLNLYRTFQQREESGDDE